jgi:hypothetical protein
VIADWKPIETAPLDETPILVWLETPAHDGCQVHGAVFHKNLKSIGGRFEFDMPKATHWDYAPKGP